MLNIKPHGGVWDEWEGWECGASETGEWKRSGNKNRKRQKGYNYG